MRFPAGFPLVAVLVAAPVFAAPSLGSVPVPRLAEAATAARPAWSVVSAETVGGRATALHFQVGYPGIFASVLVAQDEHFDVGGKLGFMYGSESGTFIAPGVRLQGLLRFLLGQKGKVRFGLEFEPGLFTYFGYYYYPFLNRTPGASLGITLPLKLTLGIPVSPRVSVHAGVDLPLMVSFLSLFEIDIPILIGGGVEFLVTPDVSLNFRMRFGPAIWANSFNAGVRLGVDILLGVAVRL